MLLWGVLLALLVVVNVKSSNNVTEKCPNVRSELSTVRKKRHLTFPDGTNAVVTLSLVKAFMTHAPAGWNLALEADVLFPLPDANFTNTHFRRKLHHRQRRDFWERLKDALNLHNFNGHSCILRSICEAKKVLAPPGKSLVHDILRAVFTVPQHEEEYNELQNSYSELLDPQFCEKVDACPLSLINFVTILNKR